VTPYLEGVNATIDFISPFVSIEPTAGAAIGLVKASISVRLPPPDDRIKLTERRLLPRYSGTSMI
jgi:hypothetical protein